ncbi:MAG: hypothetical protein ACI8UD_001417 [Planctomycetota bacterium]|jgi:hypothetical protein
MRYLPLIAGVLLICAPAKADKFWLTDPKSEQNTAAGSSPNLIQGVLVAEDDDGYHVRTEGGEILLPKSSVFKIEKDDLTIDAIVKAEKDAKQDGQTANESRRAAQASQKRMRDVRIEDASMTESAQVVEASTPLSDVLAAPAGFDPILGVARGFNSQYAMMYDAQAAWTLTQDRRYLQLLRQLRRMR